MAQQDGQSQTTPLTEAHQYELAKLKEDHRAEQLRRWDQMHIALAVLVIVVVTFFIAVFALRGDVQGMSSAAAIGSGWVGAVLGWIFTKYASTTSASAGPSASGDKATQQAGANAQPASGQPPAGSGGGHSS